MENGISKEPHIYKHHASIMEFFSVYCLVFLLSFPLKPGTPNAYDYI